MLKIQFYNSETKRLIPAWECQLTEAEYIQTVVQALGDGLTLNP